MKAKQLIWVFTLCLVTPFAFAQGTRFTYQGRLAINGVPANGFFDFRFTLTDAPAGGNTLGGYSSTFTSVSNGLFTAPVDFGGNAFDGNARWMQIDVRTNTVGPGGYVAISPAQPITPAPYAINASFPAGTIVAYLGTNPPAGWLLCDGSAVSRTNYARLFDVIGIANGAGNGSTTFNLPDLRGNFLRGLDGTAGVDPDKAARVAANPGGNTGNALGSLQTDQVRNHNHANGNFNRILQLNTGGATTVTGTDVTAQEPDIVNAAPLTGGGGNETRPRNIYANFIIKF